MSDSPATLLRSRRTEDRLKAIRQIIGMPEGDERSALLLKALEDRTGYVASLAAQALSRSADWDACGRMAERFGYLCLNGISRDPGCHIRANLAFAFGHLEYFPAINVLQIGIRTVQIEPVGGVPFDTGTHLRANCALSLAQLHARDALPDITLLLFDHGSGQIGTGDIRGNLIEARKAAARALGHIADPAALIPLMLRLQYPHNEAPEVLQECMQALVELDDPRAVSILKPYLAMADQNMAAFAAVMIAQTRAPEALELILGVLGRLGGDALRAAVMAISSLRTEAADATLKQLACDERAELRAAAIEALPANPVAT